MSLLLPLELVAWCGRLLCWGFLSLAWMYFCRSLKIPALLAPFALAAWIFGVHYGHWAGEWAVGGFEGKSLAYPCVLFGLGAAIENRWKHAWIWLAVAVIWHPLVGGWAGLSLVIVWLFFPNTPTLLQQWPWVLAAFAISLIGVLPALGGIQGGDPSGVAAQVHVFFRLDHHLRATTFAEERHFAALVSTIFFVLVCIGWFAAWWPQRKTTNSSSRQHLRGSGLLLCVAWTAMGFAAIGWIIDSQIGDSKSVTHQPILAAKLLRFYWFRWADAVVPLAWSATLWQGIGFGMRGTTSVLKPSENQRLLAAARKVGLAVLATTIVFLAAFNRYRDWDNPIPPADDLVVNTFGERREIDWLEGESSRHIDWLAVCSWIRENTPEDSLWLTPKYQQTFKWYAQRAEVVCWKDVPQDNASVIEWYRRVTLLRPRVTPSGLVRGWTNEEIRQLKEEFDFDYVLIDRTYYAEHDPVPRFEYLYPIGVNNRSFAVFRVE